MLKGVLASPRTVLGLRSQLCGNMRLARLRIRRSLGPLPGSLGPLPAETTTSRVASPLEGPVGVGLLRRVSRSMEVATLHGFLNQGWGFSRSPRTAIWGRAWLVEHAIRAKVLHGSLKVSSSVSWVTVPAGEHTCRAKVMYGDLWVSSHASWVALPARPSTGSVASTPEGDCVPAHISPKWLLHGGSCECTFNN